MIADRIKERRALLRITAETMAARTLIPLERYQALEAADIFPESEEIGRLAKQLECTASYLLGLVDNPTQELKEQDLAPNERRLLEAFRQGQIPPWMLTWMKNSAERNQKRDAKKD